MQNPLLFQQKNGLHYTKWNIVVFLIKNKQKKSDHASIKKPNDIKLETP